MATWQEKLSEFGSFLSTGIMKDEGKPNWIGVASGLGLAAVGALVASTFGPVVMLVATLALGGLGLGVGAMLEQQETKADIDPDIPLPAKTAGQDLSMITVGRVQVPDISEAKEILKAGVSTSVSIKTPPVLMGSPLPASTISSTTIKEQNKQDHLAVVAEGAAQQAAEKAANRYAQQTANLIRAAEQTETFLDEKSPAMTKLKEDLLAIAPKGGKPLLGVIQAQAVREGKDASRSDLMAMPLDQLHGLARNGIVYESRVLYDRQKDTNKGISGWVNDNRNAEVEHTAGHTLDAYKAGTKTDLDNFDRLLDVGNNHNFGANESIAALKSEEGVHEDIKTRLGQIEKLGQYSKLQQAYNDHRASSIKTIETMLAGNIQAIESKTNQMLVAQANQAASAEKDTSIKEIPSGTTVSPSQTATAPSLGQAAVAAL